MVVIGGADCAYDCPVNAPSCTGSKYELGNIHTYESDAFDTKMQTAGEILTSFGDATVTYGSKLHMSMNYFCCYSETDLDIIRNVLNNYTWPSVEVNFDKPVWRIDSDAVDVDHYSIIVLIDEASQAKMSAIVTDVEDHIRAAGLDIHVPRELQEPFHATLGVVNGLSYPTVSALNAVVDAFPSGSWTSDGPITLGSPTWG
mgnify:CR=1 FL=1